MRHAADWFVAEHTGLVATLWGFLGGYRETDSDSGKARGSGGVIRTIRTVLGADWHSKNSSISLENSWS